MLINSIFITCIQKPKYTDYANNFDDSKKFNNDVYVRDNTSISRSFTSTSHSLSSGKQPSNLNYISLLKQSPLMFLLVTRTNFLKSTK